MGEEVGEEMGEEVGEEEGLGVCGQTRRSVVQGLRVQEEHGGQEEAHGQEEHLGDPEPTGGGGGRREPRMEIRSTSQVSEYPTF